jgi:hypothetical protein
MREALGPQRYAPVLIALAIGDQAGVTRVADQNRSEPVLPGRALIPKEVAESGQLQPNNLFMNRGWCQTLRHRQFDLEVAPSSRQARQSRMHSDALHAKLRLV